MKTTSVIRTSDLHENKNAYRTATKEYLMVYVVLDTNEFVPCLLTSSDISAGIDRAAKNLEDVIPLSSWQMVFHRAVSMWQRTFK